MLITAMRHLLAEVDPKAKKTKNDIQLDKPISSITLLPNRLTYKDKSVKQLTLIGYFCNKGPESDDPASIAATRVLVQFNDGSYSVLRFKDSKSEYQFALRGILEEEGGISEKAFLHYGEREKPKGMWAYKTLHYSSEERQFYDEAHKAIAKALVKKIKENPHYLEQAKKHGIYLLSLGCGDGKDIDVCCAELHAAGFKYSAVGLDSSLELIEANKERGTPHRFIWTDIGEMSDLLNALNTGKKFVAVVASGSLSRKVLDGTRPVQEILQQLSATRKGHILIAGSVTHSLITRQGALSSGWNLKSFNYRMTGEQLFICDRQSEAEEFETTLSRSRARLKDPTTFSTLDLSMTANPLQQCRSFLEREVKLVDEVTQIDLSWSHLSTNNISSLLELFSKFKKITHVTISRYEPWAEDFIQALQKILSSVSFTLLKRNDSHDSAELPTLSIPDCRRLGMYQTVPNEVIMKGTAKLASEQKEPVAAVIHFPTDTSVASSRDVLLRHLGVMCLLNKKALQIQLLRRLD